MQWLSRRLRRIARYRLLRARWNRFKRRVLARSFFLFYRGTNYAHRFANRIVHESITHFAAATAVVLAFSFIGFAPETFFTSAKFDVGDFHLACAGIIGTALALVLSLSIVPAQKAADVFSSAILQLYARDRVLWTVFASLACLTLLSVLLGTDWAFGVGPRWTIALQLILLGIALDRLRAFYLRALELLSPQTALVLVRDQCQRLLKIMARDARRLARIVEIGSGKHSGLDNSSAQWLAFQRSPASQHLIGWIHQLEEFAHKAVARRDTQAVNSALMTMTAIGMNYAEVRRDSIVLVRDFSSILPTGVSDVHEILNPIHKSITNVCQDAAREPNEAVVTSCIRELGRMAAQAMTIVHTQGNLWSTLISSHVAMCRTSIRINRWFSRRIASNRRLSLRSVRLAAPSFQSILVLRPLTGTHMDDVYDGDKTNSFADAKFIRQLAEAPGQRRRGTPATCGRARPARRGRGKKRTPKSWCRPQACRPEPCAARVSPRPWPTHCTCNR